MPSTSSRLGLQEPQTSDAATVLRTSIVQHATILDAAVIYGTGTISNRSTVFPTPKIGYKYYATDAKRWYLYNGSAWDPQLPAYATRIAVSSITAAPGDFVVAVPGVTITLPAAVLDASLIISSNQSVTGASPVTVTRASSDVIYGPGLSPTGSSSFKLGSPITTVTLQCDGAGNWVIVSGQPNTGWVSPTLVAPATATGGSFFAPQACLEGLTGRVRGSLTAGGGIFGGTTWVTLPFAPTKSIPLIAVFDGSPTEVTVDTSGHLSVPGLAATAGQILSLDGCAPFDLS